MLFIFIPLVILNLLSLLSIEISILNISSTGPMVGILSLLSVSFFLLLIKTYTSYVRMWLIVALFFFHLMAFLVEDLMVMVFISDIIIVLVIVSFSLTSSSSKSLISSLYLALYVTLPSSPLLVYSMYKFNMSESSNFSLFSPVQDNLSTLSVLTLILSGMGKLPMYGMHYWLPNAHVQSPTPLSIILASLSLNISVILLLYVVFSFSMSYTSLASFTLLFIWSLFSSSSCSLSATDSKVFLAYCSVSHMTLSSIGLFYMTIISSWGSWMLALSHCLTSPALFYIAGNMQQSSGTRSFYNPPYQNLTLLSLMIIIFCLVDMPFPPVASFWSELFVLSSVVSKMSLCAILIVVPFILILRSYEHFFYHVNIENTSSIPTHLTLIMSILVVGMFL